MHKTLLSRQRHNERGQTILLVAISLVSLLGMAALAIDIVTLYAARSEIQRAADAAALAGAKAIADSGFTTLPTTDPNYSNAQALALLMATNSINAVTLATPPINLVAGMQPLEPLPPSVDWSHQGNPRITVTLERSNLPTFFSKIWGTSAAKVTATATAEAYNPANSATITPIAPLSVKPWLVANADPTGTALTFVDTTSPNWVVDSGVIGKSFDLVVDCSHPGPNKCHPAHNPGLVPGATSPQVEYVPAVVTTPNTQNVCPACAGASDYEQSIECADAATSYQVLSCGGGAAQAQWDDDINPGRTPGNNATSLGGQCLIHASSEGSAGQDTLTELNPMFSAPYQIKQKSGNLVTTSSSIVTIPIIDNNPLIPGGGAVTVVGFLQAFINQVDPSPVVATEPPEGSINITVLNIAGCSSSNNGASPVVGASGTSPVPVRLITSP
jgi:Flp pilus assembly protein TadG